MQQHNNNNVTTQHNNNNATTQHNNTVQYHHNNNTATTKTSQHLNILTMLKEHQNNTRST